MKKRYSILFYSVLIIGYLLFAILMNRAYKKASNPVMSRPVACSSVIIDAGHGGEDSGAIGQNSVMEKDINLGIAKVLKEMLITSGFEVIMVRDEDISIHNEGCSTLRQKKHSDLHNRLKFSKNNPESILISIHQNAFTDKTYQGAQMFYSQNNPLSKDLADCMKDSFVKLLQPKNNREVKAAGKNIFLLKSAQIPAVIIECGFMSNPSELKKLCDKEYQKQLAFSIYCGYMQYWQDTQTI